eukprot:GFUD01024959.1.p1 GENE.GFUD01024959.1~~GFUD01024959.1.p1  ORF type:complete len:129 (-),score=35.04 GFUD01024959.1:174-560(-)
MPEVGSVLANLNKSWMSDLELSILDFNLPHSIQKLDTRTYLDIIMNTIGALLGRQECSEIIACRTGKFVGHKVPGASLGVMMIEGIVPKSLSSWFGVVKTAVIDRSDQDCDEDYKCRLVDDEENDDEW